jgi:predicted acetyltransferase
MAAFDDTLSAAKKSYFDSKYQSNQLHLRVLATHPDFQRRGAGSALCRWGMEYAGDRGQPVTLLSSPMGQQLYSYLGFDYLGTVTVQVEGEAEKLCIGAMMYPAASN